MTKAEIMNARLDWINAQTENNYRIDAAYGGYKLEKVNASGGVSEMHYKRCSANEMINILDAIENILICEKDAKRQNAAGNITFRTEPNIYGNYKYIKVNPAENEYTEFCTYPEPDAIKVRVKDIKRIKQFAIDNGMTEKSNN